YGPEVERIVLLRREKLTLDDANAGSMTDRLLTQLACIYYHKQIVRFLRRAVLLVRQRLACDVVRPVTVGSFSGGCGSALQVIIPRYLALPPASQEITAGLPSGVVAATIPFLVDPVEYELETEGHTHRLAMLSNEAACSVEQDLLNRAGVFSYIFSQGLANAAGTTLDRADRAAEAAALSLGAMITAWAWLKGRFVDTCDRSRLYNRYKGTDLPESLIDPALIPSYGTKPSTTATTAPAEPAQAAATEKVIHNAHSAA
ncbi:MAG: hypothetical protein NTW87_12100, partial [Planctomycetota bacterium]|nr:hypothetical protein [Planctomycetota bacterium]